MHNRVWAAGRAAIALLGLAAALAGCASAAGGTASVGSQPGMHAPSSSPPGAGGGPDIPVVELTASFSPSTVQLGVGQQFEVIVATSVRVSGLNVAGCTSGQPAPLPGGLLSVQCRSATEYIYNAGQAGTARLSATVRPRCAAGTMCPQWIARPALKVTISS